LARQESPEDSKSSLNDGKEKIQLYENKDLRQVQILLLQNISTGFERCKYLKDEFSEGSNAADRNKNILGRGEAAKPKKVHHDESLISQITGMGFERKLAKKALKLTGDVSSAVTFLLEDNGAALIDVSDSEEVDDKNAGDSKKIEDDKAALEAELKKVEDEKE